MTAKKRPLQLHASWQALLGDQFDLPYMRSLRDFLLDQKRLGKVVYPSGDKIFAAMNLLPVDQVKVVLIGQDPYHGPGQAQGLCFSVPEGVQLPPSLRNIYREIQTDLGLTTMPKSGDLTAWASQGVLLLNAVLTVEHAKAGSHQGRGWEQFTDMLVERLTEKLEGLIFLLWGSYAQKKGQLVDTSRHHVLTAPHPSPLSAHRGFFGCGHFSQVNRILEAQQLPAIDWQAGLIR
ncbi:MAG TPA: uracil-DNA glycosylase [Gammaproteobacteria bacterium]|nr:uracil-DNA glycosylase [Gammaproteobacteria bacterium]